MEGIMEYKTDKPTFAAWGIITDKEIEKWIDDTTRMIAPYWGMTRDEILMAVVAEE